MAKKVVTTLVLSIVKNKKNEFQIMRDGGMLKSFESGTMDAPMILRYAANLGRHINQIENCPIKVVDNFTKKTPCCPNCGSINVETKAWVNLKNGSTETVSTDAEDQYCSQCDSHDELDEKIIDPKVGIIVLELGM